MRKIVYIIIIGVVFALANTQSLHAQDSLSSRPKIGLVLGGGGARGLAHVGVLKVLKELNIPVDYIVGTSMGAIVGSLFAQGLSPEEIEKIVNSIDWEDVFNDSPSLIDKPLKDKEDDRKYINNFEVGFNKGKVILPRGLIAGQKLTFILKALTLKSYDITDFKKLPIPFAAVATDIETGQEVILDHGDLSLAIEASMAVPGVFVPKEVEGRLLVDGGLVNNLPVDVAKEMGADIIIAVDVSLPLAKRDELKTMLNITSQMINIMTTQNVKKQLKELKPEDILLKPDLKDLSVMNFDKAKDIIIKGEEAAISAKDKFSKYSLAREDYLKIWSKIKSHPLERLHIDFIEIGPTKISKEIVRDKLTIKDGEEVNISKLKEDLLRVYDSGYFEKVDFKFLKQDGKNGLLILPVEKSWGPNYIRLGSNVSNDFSGYSYYNFLLSYTMTELNSYGGQLKNEFQAGTTCRAYSEFYQPLDYSQYFFMAPRAKCEQQIQNIYNKESSRIAEYRIRSGIGGMDLGLQLSKYAELRLGIEGGVLNARPIIGDNDLPRYDQGKAAIVSSFIFDQLDSPFFPQRGMRLKANGYFSEKVLGAKEAYNKIMLQWSQAISFGKHTFFADLEFAGKLGSQNIPYYDLYTLGGFLNLSGYHKEELRGRYLQLNKLVYYYKVLKLPPTVGKGVYIGASAEGGNIWDKSDNIGWDDLIWGGSLFLGVDTIIGPICVAYGYNDDNKSNFYLYFGQAF